MKVIIGQSAYEMTAQQLNRVLKVASKQVPLGIYAIKKGRICELHNITMRFRLYLFCELIKQFFRFLKSIKSFYKFYSDYEYDGETCRFIIEQYTQVLCNRTRLMSKPTYNAGDVISQLDDWYSDHAE